jgi:CBS domain-containing protein
MNVAALIQSRTEVFSIPSDMTVHDAARYLREKEIRAVGVCDQTGKLVGVISQSDISDKVAAENKCPAWMRVSEIMTATPIIVPLEAPLDECMRLMEQHGIFHLAVVDSRHGYRGMISVADLLRVIATDHKDRADMLEALLFPQR